MPESTDLVEVTQKRYRCRHLHATGKQCGSPALRNETFCYFHHITRRPKPPAAKSRYLDAHEPFILPLVEDRASALSVAAQLLCRIASNDLDVERAGRLLYNLQVLTQFLPPEPNQAAPAAPPPAPEPPVHNPVLDEAHGLLAPITEMPPEPPTAESQPLTADSQKPTATPTSEAATAAAIKPESAASPAPESIIEPFQESIVSFQQECVISTEGEAEAERPPHFAPAQPQASATQPATKNRLPRSQRNRHRHTTH